MPELTTENKEPIIMTHIFKTFLVMTVLSASVQAKPINLDIISELADSICGTYATGGSMHKESITYERDEISDELLAELKIELSERFENVVITEKTITFKNESYSGIPQKDIAKHNSAIQECRKKVGLAAINRQIQASK